MGVVLSLPQAVDSKRPAKIDQLIMIGGFYFELINCLGGENWEWLPC